MKTKSIMCLLGLVTVVAVMTGKAVSDDKVNGHGQPSQADMEKCMMLGQPGAQHKALEPLVGKWNVVSKFWMDPSAPPSESKGTSESRWVLGGRFVEDHFKGAIAMPGPDGKMMETPFEGQGMTGYDNGRKTYVGSWADSMGTCLITFKGSSSDGKTFVYYGEMDDPMQGVMGGMVKYVTRIISKDKHVFEMYNMHGGETKMMEITYTRQ